MITTRNYIIENLDLLSEQQLIELADFTAFLIIRSRTQINTSKESLSDLYSKYSVDDIKLAESGMAEYYNGLIKEEILI
jgi:hypothetical protein